MTEPEEIERNQMEMSDEQSSYYYKHRQEGHPQYGPALRCPTCGGTEFFIFRGRLFTDQERKTIESIADCKKCSTVNIQGQNSSNEYTKFFAPELFEFWKAQIRNWHL